MNNEVRKPIKVIDIPNGCIAVVTNGKVEFYETSARRLRKGEYRCKDCVNRILGNCTYNGDETYVCIKKPKEIKNETFKESKMYVEQKLYYHSGRYDKICDKFELKKNKHE
jgi:hypothetical protein